MPFQLCVLGFISVIVIKTIMELDLGSKGSLAQARAETEAEVIVECGLLDCSLQLAQFVFL